MLIKYVTKALIPVGSDSSDGDQGPFYRYFQAGSLEEAAETAFRNRHALFAGGTGAGIFGGMVESLGFESVYALAVKEVGRGNPWRVILDMKGEFLSQKNNHEKYKSESVARKYGERAFKDRTEYVFELLGIKRNPTA